MNYTDLWPLIQADILGALSADEFLGTRVGVLVEPGDSQSVIAGKLAKAVGSGLDGKSGVGFLVLPIERAEDDNPAVPGGPLKLTIDIQWTENTVTNNSDTGTRIPIRIWAQRTAHVLKLYTPVGLAQNLVAQNPVVSEFTDDTNKILRVGQVSYTTYEADFTPYVRLNRPQITVSGGAYPHTVTVSAPDAATIYYTTDGSHPYERNAKAQIYLGPVTVSDPCLFRVRSFNPPKIASDTAAFNFS